MTRHIFTFLATFILGALVALAARTITHKPHAQPTPASQAATPSTASDPHASHGAAPASTVEPAAPAASPVNTRCAICGMAVDPKVPTATYQGKTIGFGCKMCPPKFRAEPDKYGPLYLRNEVLKP